MAKLRSIGKPPEINGFVNLYKPPGITSMDALRQIKRITGQRKKVGHRGTMDPLARGVLPVCFGQATRLMDYVVRGRKMYRVEISLGIDTTTYDAEGERSEEHTSELQSLVNLVCRLLLEKKKKKRKKNEKK